MYTSYGSITLCGTRGHESRKLQQYSLSFLQWTTAFKRARRSRSGCGIHLCRKTYMKSIKGLQPPILPYSHMASNSCGRIYEYLLVYHKHRSYYYMRWKGNIGKACEISTNPTSGKHLRFFFMRGSQILPRRDETVAY